MSENVPDPLIEFLNKLNFDNVPLFEELHQQQFDKDLCFKYYKLSTEVALFHMRPSRRSQTRNIRSCAIRALP